MNAQTIKRLQKVYGYYGLQKMIEMLESKGADASAIKQQLQEATGGKYGTG